MVSLSVSNYPGESEQHSADFQGLEGAESTFYYLLYTDYIQLKISTIKSTLTILTLTIQASIVSHTVIE